MSNKRLALVFSYDYHPLAKTLQEKHFGGRSGNTASWGSGVPETLLWSYVIQIGSALRQIHSASLAARVILPSKILVTGKNRYILIQELTDLRLISKILGYG